MFLLVCGIFIFIFVIIIRFFLNSLKQTYVSFLKKTDIVMQYCKNTRNKVLLILNYL